ncbi:MAG: glycoside hydrolase family 25 protein [Leadbetterella sp.]
MVSFISVAFQFLYVLLLSPTPERKEIESTSIEVTVSSPAPEKSTASRPLEFELHGIDVSHYQSSINWQKVMDNGHDKFKISFCFIKATEGSSYTDAKFHQNWVGSSEVGLQRGAYHFFSPGTNPKAQARNFIRMVSLQAGDLAPVLDVETENEEVSKKTFRKNVKSWLLYVEHHYGVKPILYTNEYIFNKYLRGYFEDYPLWFADYNSRKLNTNLDHPNVRFWQYSERGRIRGIRGNVDCNVFVGSAYELAKLTI